MSRDGHQRVMNRKLMQSLIFSARFNIPLSLSPHSSFLGESMMNEFVNNLIISLCHVERCRCYAARAPVHKFMYELDLITKMDF